MIRRVGCTCVSTLAWAAVLNANAEPDQDAPPEFIQVLPTTIQWLPSPVPGLHVANLQGSPQEPGPFVICVKLLPGAKVMPHTHSRPSSYTALAGEWTLGFARHSMRDCVPLRQEATTASRQPCLTITRLLSLRRSSRSNPSGPAQWSSSADDPQRK